MSILVVNRKRTRQPQSASCVSDSDGLLLLATGHTCYDYVSCKTLDRNWTSALGGNNLSPACGSKGQGFKGGQPKFNAPDLTKFTFTAVVDARTYSNWAPIVAGGLFWLDIANNGSPQSIVSNNITAIAIQNTINRVITVVFDGTTLFIYVDGILRGYGNPGFGSIAATTWTLGDTVENIGYTLMFASLHKRAFSAAETLSVANNPWQIFKPKKQFSYFDLGSGTNVAIAGSSQSVSYGLVIPSSAIAQTGQQVSSNSGSIAASIQYLAQLTGLSSSTVAGAIAPALLAALGGQAANFSQGPLSTAISAAISGIDTASAQGTLTALQVIEKALSGQESAFSSGPIAAVLDLALSGSEITASFGTVAASLGVIQALTGLSSTASVGDIIAALNTAVSGIENTLAGGTVTPLTGIIAQLSGLESSLLEGSIATAVTRILSGQAAEIQNGSPIVGRTVSVSGNEISSAENQVGVSIAIGQIGATAVLHNGVISVYNPDVTLGLIGSQSAIQYGLLSKEAQLALFGQDLAISGGQLVAIVEALGLGQSINIMQGSASLSVDKSLSGLVTLSGNGTVVFTDNNLQVALNGQSILTSAGRIFIKGGALGSSSITILQV